MGMGAAEISGAAADRVLLATAVPTLIAGDGPVSSAGDVSRGESDEERE